MLPKVVQAYAEQGYRVDLGNPSRLFSRLLAQGRDEACQTGGGISLSDGLLFVALSRAMTAAGIFVVGNAFGLSTFVLADLFPAATVDVIDAEVEGEDNQRGSAVTRKIAAAHFPNVQLTSGFSPRDVAKATRCAKYQLAFVDGLHTDEQMVADFNGLLPILDDGAAVVFHDVASTPMFRGWQQVRESAAAQGFEPFELAFTQFGDAALVRELPAVKAYLATVAAPFGKERYHIGIAPGSASRPKFWIKSPYEVELLLKRTISKLFGRSR